MSYPVTIPAPYTGYGFGNSEWGSQLAFEHSGAQYAFLTQDGAGGLGSGDLKPHCMKSTDFGLTWTEVDAAGAPTISHVSGTNGTMYTVWRDGATVYLLSVNRPSSGTVSGFDVWTFDLGTGAWSGSAATYTTPVVHVQNGNIVNVQVAVRGAGDFVLYYSGAPETVAGFPRSRVYYATFDGATFGAGTLLPGQAGNATAYSAMYACADGSGVTHFLYAGGGAGLGTDISHVGLTAAGAFGALSLITGDFAEIGFVDAQNSSQLVLIPGTPDRVGIVCNTYESGAFDVAMRMFYGDATLNPTWASSVVLPTDATALEIFSDNNFLLNQACTLTANNGKLTCFWTVPFPDYGDRIISTGGVEPWGICYDQNGHVWSCDFNTGQLFKFSTTSLFLVDTIALANCNQCCYDAGTNTIWATYDPGTGRVVAKIDATTDAIIGSYAVGSSSTLGGLLSDGTRIWVANSNDNTVTVLLAADGSLVATVPTGAQPGAVCFDGASVWTANQSGSTVTKITAATQAAVGTYPVGAQPQGIVSDGTSVWVSDGGYSPDFFQSLEKLDKGTGAVAATYALGDSAVDLFLGLAWDPTTGTVWMCDGYGGGGNNLVYAVNAADGTVTGTYDAYPDGAPLLLCLARGGISIGVTVWISNNNFAFLTELQLAFANPVRVYEVHADAATLAWSKPALFLEAPAFTGAPPVFATQVYSYATSKGVALLSVWYNSGDNVLAEYSLVAEPSPDVEAWLVIREPSIGLTDRSNYLYKSSGVQHSWTQEVRQRGQATVDLVVPSGDSYSPTRATQLFLYDQTAAGFTRVFAGIIQDVEDRWLDNAGTRRLAVTAMSMESVFDTVYAEPTQYVDKTCGFILTDLFNRFESGCPVTLGVIDAGETIPLLNVKKGDRLSDIFTQLATTSLFTWGVNPVDLKLNFRDPSSDPAPFTLTSEDVLWDTPNWKVRGADFRDKQGVRVGFDAFPHSMEFFPVSGAQQSFTLRNPAQQVVKCYVTLSTCNTATGSFSGVPSPGDTVTIGPNAAPWIANHAYALGGQVVVGGFVQEVTTAGTTGATQPAFGTATGDTTADFTVVWTCRGPSGFSTGTYTYTWVAVLDNTQFGQVLIDPTVAGCAQNLADAINATPLFRRVRFSLPTWENSQCNAISVTGTGFTLQQKAAGSGWVAAMSATGTAFSWSSGTTSGGTSPQGSVGPNLGATADIGVFASGTSSAADSLVYTEGSAAVYLTTPRPVTPVGLNIEYTRVDGDVTEVEDSALIAQIAALTGGTGVYAQFTDQSSTGLISTSADAALQMIQQALAAFKVPPATFRFDTLRPGLRAGMTLAAAISKPVGASTLLDGLWVIESVDASLIEPAKVPYLTPELGHYRYTVSCVNVNQIGSWLDFWNGGGGGGGGSSSLVATSGGAVNSGGQPSLLLEVNTSPNLSQAVLNLKNGAHVTVTDGGAGDVTIDAPVMLGDSGSGGAAGVAPAPAAGDAAAGKFLKADATWEVSTVGLSLTITTAKLTGGGSNGSMTFVNGVLTSQVAAT